MLCINTFGRVMYFPDQAKKKIQNGRTSTLKQTYTKATHKIWIGMTLYWPDCCFLTESLYKNSYCLMKEIRIEHAFPESFYLLSDKKATTFQQKMSFSLTPTRRTNRERSGKIAFASLTLPDFNYRGPTCSS